MVEGNDWKLGRSTAKIVTDVASGRMSPDAQRDLANKTALGPKAGAGDVGLKGHDVPAQPNTAKGLLGKPLQQTGQNATPRPATSEKTPLTVRPDATAGHETAHSAATSQPRVSPNSPEMEKAVQEGKQAFNALQNLAGGGVKKAIQNLPTAAATPKELLQKALASMMTGTKSKAQDKPTETAAKTATPTRTSEEPATKEAVAAKVKAEADGTRSGDAGEAAAKAQLIAQKVPSPLLSEAGARREEDRGKVATDGPTAKALANVVTGRGITAIATAQEFTAGGNGGFGDPNGESSGLAGKVGTAPQIHVYGDTKDYPETELLYAKLGLSTVLYGAQELAQRAIPVGERIANTQDDTPLSQRVQGDRASQEQAAFGTRGSVYGPGKIIG